MVDKYTATAIRFILILVPAFAAGYVIGSKPGAMIGSVCVAIVCLMAVGGSLFEAKVHREHDAKKAQDAEDTHALARSWCAACKGLFPNMDMHEHIRPGIGTTFLCLKCYRHYSGGNDPTTYTQNVKDPDYVRLSKVRDVRWPGRYP